MIASTFKLIAGIFIANSKNFYNGIIIWTLGSCEKKDSTKVLG